MMYDAPPPRIWLPPKPAIIRPAPCQRATFPFPVFVPMAAAEAAFPEVAATNVSTSNSSTMAVALPAGISAGDLLIIMMAVKSQGGP